MTDITELAHREKFEAWWERTQHNGNPPRFGWSHWRDGEGYKVDDDNSELDGMWSAWKAAGAELVEALEKAQTINAAAEKLVRCKGRYHSEQNYRALAALFGVKTPDLPPLEHENVHYADAAEMEIAALRQRIAELENYAEAEAVGADRAAEDSVYWMKRCKELESRTVTFKLPFTPEPSAFAPWTAKAFYQFHKDTVKSCVAVFSDACAAAGIKVEAE